jgi:hypothetical protein
MPTQTPILKPQTYIRPPEQAIGSRELDSIKVIIAAVVLAVIACLAAVGISAAICVYVAPPTEVNQLKT